MHGVHLSPEKSSKYVLSINNIIHVLSAIIVDHNVTIAFNQQLENPVLHNSSDVTMLSNCEERGTGS